jgi:magnesium-transporting ATPase (P-type)
MTWRQMRQWHAMSTGDVVNALESDAHRGLSEAEAERRLREVGPNTVTGRGGPGAFRRFLAQFANPLVYVLLVAGAVTAFLPDHALDAAVIFGVVLANAVIGFMQESRAQAAIDSLSRLVRVQATVVREGRSRQIEAAGLVPGDLVVLRSGDRVSADVRLLQLRDLQIDESMLTGESIPVAKEVDAVDAEAMLADRKDVAYSGTLVTFGQVTGTVVATGANTELGRISHLIETAADIATPLTRRLAQFSKLLTWAIMGLSALTLGLGLLRGNPFGEVFIATVALAVAAIPEGLPAAVTIILSIGVTRMARRNAIVRHLPAVETLGSTTTICSDKTGTLTKNEMTVTAILADGARYRATGTGYDPAGGLLRGDEPVRHDDSVPLRECLSAGVLCNESHLLSADGVWRIEGDPTEGALLTVAAKAGLDPEPLRDSAHLLDAIPFESERQYMATLHRMPDGRVRIYAKGAVERILGLCATRMAGDGSPISLVDQTVIGYADELAAEGLRVLAFAIKDVPADRALLHEHDLDHDLVFVGLQGMIDPPRPEAVVAVRACQAAGISVKMITGDHALTARTIAREIGIATSDDQVMSGTALAALADADWPEVAARVQVFARVAPEQKLRLVEALQSRGAVVAMTGDGVNDAPALKQADIGVAMGITGTEAAKDAADMVLADDNFASIEAAVEEGRGVYDNLRKFITWTIPTNGGEGMLLLVAIVFGFAIPILPLHVLWINLTTAIALGMMLAFEPKEPGLMQRAARDPKEPILTRLLIWRTAYVIALMVLGSYLLFAWERGNGVSLQAAQTSVACVVVLVETAYLLNCRSLHQSIFRIGLFSNRWAIFGVLLMIVLQLIFVYAPVMNRLFATEPIPASAWIEIVLIAVVVFVVVEVEKWFTRGSDAQASKGD